MQTEKPPTTEAAVPPRPERPRSPLAMVATAIVLGLTAMGAGWWLQSARQPDPDFAYGMKLAQPRPLKPVSLAGGSGTVNLPYRDGKWTLMFFGFTHCPDICPTTLQYLKQEVKALGSRREQLHVTFVSVDPKRDKPADLQRFVQYYDPAFIGVTGDKASLDQLTADAGAAYYMGVKADQPGANYDVTHSTSIYVVDPKGRVVAVYGGEGKPGKLAQDFHFLPESR
jgi:protein SCO1/2